MDLGTLARRKVGVSDAAASRMLRTLADKGVVRVEPYQGAELTCSRTGTGRRCATGTWNSR